MPIPTDGNSSGNRAILSAPGLQLPARGARPVLTIDVVLGPGELQVIHTRHKDRSGDIADALLGLVAGEPPVRFLDRAWRDLDTREALHLRRCIGRVQARGNWMETRSVMDNLLLPALHNTVLPEQQLRDGASALARRFGLPGLPMQQPGDCAAADLERAACVRAFLGRPFLVVLEHPMESDDSALLVPLMNAIQQVRRRGGSVLWFTEHIAHIMDTSLAADRYCQLVDTRLVDFKPDA